MCGVIGLVGKSNVFQDLYDGLLGLQHRGQDAAGIVVADGARIALRKDNGLVSKVFEQRHMLKLTGSMGIGHVRYPTAGSASSAEAQPMYVNAPYGICLAHNGNLTNAIELRREIVETENRHLNTASDSEILLNIFANELQATASRQVRPEDIFAAVVGVQRRCRGAFAAIALIVGGGVVGFRDSRGIRPLVIGKRVGGLFTEYMLASESSALTSIGFELVRDVAPGEAAYITENGELHTEQCVHSESHNPCIFEYVYLARPDSVIDKISVYQARLRMGEALAERVLAHYPGKRHDIDVVIPIPDTSRIAAVPVSEGLNVKYSDAFVKNRYIGRTFIMPGQQLRQRSVKTKLNAIPEEFDGRHVLLVEDSIVRGTTIREIIQQARSAGARKVSVAVAAPPVRFPNVYGIDMPSAQEFVANDRTEDEIAGAIGADMLVYQELEDLVDATTAKDVKVSNFECSIFDGNYESTDVDTLYLERLGSERNDLTKMQQHLETSAHDDVVELHNSL